ncbi:hypothetical protein KJ765_03565 [Candidatus Micrarchaeota archaeon]|nr:hypothetical protein [Candidatus Micrarchaeota archaeon]
MNRQSVFWGVSLLLFVSWTSAYNCNDPGTTCITSVPYTISIPNHLYVLESDLVSSSGGITIDADHVILEGNHRRITFVSGNGIKSQHQVNVTVQNLELIKGSGKGGVLFQYTDDSLLKSNILGTIEIYDSDRNRFINNAVSGGLVLGDAYNSKDGSDENFISGNSFYLEDSNPPAGNNMIFFMSKSDHNTFQFNDVKLLRSNGQILQLGGVHFNTFFNNSFTQTYLPPNDGDLSWSVSLRHSGPEYSTDNDLNANVFRSNEIAVMSLAHDNTVRNNTIYAQVCYSHSAASVSQPTWTDNFVDNVCHATGLGIIIWQKSLVMTGNTIYTDDLSAVKSYQRSGATLLQRNNIFYSGSQPAYYSHYGTNDLDSDYNLYYRDTPGALIHVAGTDYNTLEEYMATGRDSHSVSGDPLFVDASTDDFHILPNSPARDSGDPSYPSSCDGRVDIGAFEYCEGSGAEVPCGDFGGSCLLNCNDFDDCNWQPDGFCDSGLCCVGACTVPTVTPTPPPMDSCEAIGGQCLDACSNHDLCTLDTDGFCDSGVCCTGDCPIPTITPTPPPSGDDVFLWIEGEDFDSTDGVWDIVEHVMSSNEHYAVVPEDQGNYVGTISYDFYIPGFGDFYLWGRVKSPSTASNSFYVTMDDQTEYTWDTPSADGTIYVWDLANSRDPDIDPLLFSLAAGEHTLTIRNREDGTWLDRLLLTSDLDYVPTGLGDPVLPTSCEDVGGTCLVDCANYDSCIADSSGFCSFGVCCTGTCSATPTPVPSCGDGICNSDAGETCRTCKSDCGECPPPYANGGSYNGGNSGDYTGPPMAGSPTPRSQLIHPTPYVTPTEWMPFSLVDDQDVKKAVQELNENNEDTQEIEQLILQAQQLEEQGKTVEAQSIWERAKEKIQVALNRIRSSKASSNAYIWLLGILLIVVIAVYVSTRPSQIIEEPPEPPNSFFPDLNME